MGVKFGVEDSSNLISAMRNNVLVANMIIDRLNAGSQHLIAHLDSGSLQGAAYTAGRGLYSELIIPGIEKLGEAVDDVQAELASYEHAHSVVAEYGDLDSDDLEQALQDAREQLHLIETQIECTNAFCAQIPGVSGVPTFSGDLTDFAYQIQTLEQLKDLVENEILEIRTKIEKLEWFVTDVSRYFSDSLQVMQLATQAAMELGKIAVEADGSYCTNGVNLDLIKGLHDMGITTHHGTPSDTPTDGVAFDSLRSASGFSYDKLVEWLSSDEGQRLHSLARWNPGLFDFVLNSGMSWEADKNPLGLLGVLIGALDSGGAAAVEGGLIINNKFPTGAEWDLKPYLAEEYDYDAGYFYLYDEQGRVVRSDVFGNVVYGAMLARWDVNVETALKGANSGQTLNVNAGLNDELDDRAVEFGYELYEKYPNGLTQDQYYNEIANADLVK